MIIVATKNQNKLKQLRLLSSNKIELKSLKDVNLDIEVDEDGKTFEENAILKAKAIFNLTKNEVLADDSGLCIDYFDGWPGIYTHRCLENGKDGLNNNVILDKMINVSDELRGAKAKCVLAYCNKNGEIKTFIGEIYGKIAFDAKGDNLFGFDPIFKLKTGKTLAELTDEEKVSINARSVAFKEFLKWYENNQLKI